MIRAAGDAAKKDLIEMANVPCIRSYMLVHKKLSTDEMCKSIFVMLHSQQKIRLCSIMLCLCLFKDFLASAW